MITEDCGKIPKGQNKTKVISIIDNFSDFIPNTKSYKDE